MLLDEPELGTPLFNKRLELLRQTWQYVRQHSSYYADLLPDRPPTSIGLDDLRSVPPLAKEELAARLFEIRCQRGLPAYMVFTGGTSGQPQVIFHSESDLSRYGSDLTTGMAPGPRALGLITGGGHHGDVPQFPGRGGHIQLPLRNRKNYEWAWQMLTRSHTFEGYAERISYTILPLPAVKKLVHFILERGYDVAQLDLDVVGTFAWHLSTPWRRFIEETLNVLVIDYFGFTEISALAVECVECGWYHWGEQVIWEVVDCVTGDPLEDGVGRLLVTALYPFATDHVLIRYDPGDLVRLGGFCHRALDRGFRPCGRRTRALTYDTMGRRHWVLFGSDVQEVLDFDPAVARIADERFGGITSCNDDAFPKWRARVDPGRPSQVMVEVEMKASPYLFSKSATELSRTLQKALVDAHTDLSKLLAEQALGLQIRLLPPGSMPDSEVWIC